MSDIFVGRQPIYSPKLEVIGYELLFRGFNTDKAEVVDGDQATSQVMLNTFLELGIERLVGKGLAFVNLTRNFILGKHPIPLPGDRVVLEVLEDITVDDELIGAVRNLRDNGFTIALDDVTNLDAVKPLLDIATIVKLDLIEMDRSTLRQTCNFLLRNNIEILAEKVETREEFDQCKLLGCVYFQGYFLNRPQTIEGKRIPESRLTILRLLSELQNPKLEIRELETIISQDVSLSYKLLRLINSVFYGARKRVGSLLQALTMLGIRQIKMWVSLIFLSRIEDKPRELLITAMVRAKMGELIAKLLRYDNSEVGFTVGLFSVLDALLDMPLEEVLETLPLSEEINEALLRQEGRFGAILKIIVSYEKGDWDAIARLSIPKEKVVAAYIESIDWATTVSGELGKDDDEDKKA